MVRREHIREAEGLIRLYGDALSEFEYGLVWAVIIRHRGDAAEAMTASEARVFGEAVEAMRAVRVKALAALSAASFTKGGAPSGAPEAP